MGLGYHEFVSTDVLVGLTVALMGLGFFMILGGVLSSWDGDIF